MPQERPGVGNLPGKIVTLRRITFCKDYFKGYLYLGERESSFHICSLADGVVREFRILEHRFHTHP